MFNLYYITSFAAIQNKVIETFEGNFKGEID